MDSATMKKTLIKWVEKYCEMMKKWYREGKFNLTNYYRDRIDAYIDCAEDLKIITSKEALDLKEKYKRYQE